MTSIFTDKRWAIILIGICLFLNLAIAVHIRVQNLSLLKRKYFVGNDAYRFTRQAKIIVEQGKLPSRDMMRYVPLGRDLTQHMNLPGYVIAGFYRLTKLFVSNMTVERAAIFYPIICFLVSLMLFFLLVQRLFDKYVGLLALTLLVVVGPMLQRTVAGFADSTSYGFSWMTTKNLISTLIFAGWRLSCRGCSA